MGACKARSTGGDTSSQYLYKGTGYSDCGLVPSDHYNAKSKTQISGLAFNSPATSDTIGCLLPPKYFLPLISRTHTALAFLLSPWLCLLTFLCRFLPNLQRMRHPRFQSCVISLPLPWSSHLGFRAQLNPEILSVWSSSPELGPCGRSLRPKCWPEVSGGTSNLPQPELSSSSSSQ